MTIRSFASDNNAGVHPLIMKALAQANHDHCIGYGDDEFTYGAQEKFKQLLEENTDVYFVFNGTGANVLAIKALCQSYQSVICSNMAHIEVDECGAPENYTGCKIITVPHTNGKINPDQLRQHLHTIGFEHHSQPGMVSISQTTELGTVYTRQELSALCNFAHGNNLLVHMDGARISNAVAALGCSLKEASFDCGIDVMSFGGTKNGMMYGEAVIFRDKSLAPHFKYLRKQAMQLGSKMRFIGAQFQAFFQDDLWLQNARHSNYMAQLLKKETEKLPGIIITQPVEANAIFAKIPKNCIETLRRYYFFYDWDPKEGEVRWMCSFDTTEKDVEEFVKILKKILAPD